MEPQFWRIYIDAEFKIGPTRPKKSDGALAIESQQVMWFDSPQENNAPPKQVNSHVGLSAMPYRALWASPISLAEIKQGETWLVHTSKQPTTATREGENGRRIHLWITFITRDYGYHTSRKYESTTLQGLCGLIPDDQIGRKSTMRGENRALTVRLPNDTWEWLRKKHPHLKTSEALRRELDQKYITELEIESRGGLLARFADEQVSHDTFTAPTFIDRANMVTQWPGPEDTVVGFIQSPDKLARYGTVLYPDGNMFVTGPNEVEHYDISQLIQAIPELVWYSVQHGNVAKIIKGLPRDLSYGGRTV